MKTVRHVLEVEDDRALCAVLGRAVSRWGAEAWEAYTLEEACAFAARTPDLALVDLWPAGEYSIGLFEELRRRHPPPAVVAISGRVSRERLRSVGR